MENLMTYFKRMNSPIGELVLTADNRGFTGLYMRTRVDESWTEDESPFREAARQLEAYFAGTLKQFDLPLAFEGTPFQLEVWKALCDIPFGTTISYRELACRVGRPTGSRAVGAANGRNPISVIAPCHRVIGADGSLTGYGGGLDRKLWLLRHEGVVVPSQKTLFSDGTTTEDLRT
jgi:methylated-DNA-[protein]-cysteine S-methyltransferase